MPKFQILAQFYPKSTYMNVRIRLMLSKISEIQNRKRNKTGPGWLKFKAFKIVKEPLSEKNLFSPHDIAAECICEEWSEFKISKCKFQLINANFLIVLKSKIRNLNFRSTSDF